jgi:hypothetical protein
MPKATSKAQARLFGAIAGGSASAARRTGLTQAKAREMLRGQKIKGLPARARKRKRR